MKCAEYYNKCLNDTMENKGNISTQVGEKTKTKDT